MRTVVHLSHHTLRHAQIGVCTCFCSHNSSLFWRPLTFNWLLVEYLNEQDAQRQNVGVGMESAGSCLSDLFFRELKSRREKRALKIRFSRNLSRSALFLENCNLSMKMLLVLLDSLSEAKAFNLVYMVNSFCKSLVSKYLNFRSTGAVLAVKDADSSRARHSIPTSYPLTQSIPWRQTPFCCGSWKTIRDRLPHFRQDMVKRLGRENIRRRKAFQSRKERKEREQVLKDEPKIKWTERPYRQVIDGEFRPGPVPICDPDLASSTKSHFPDSLPIPNFDEPFECFCCFEILNIDSVAAHWP